MTAQKVLHATAFRAAGVLCLAERRPAPAGQTGTQSLSLTGPARIVGFDVSRESAQPEVGRFTTIAGNRFKSDDVGTRTALME